MKKARKGLILLLVISTLLCQSCAGNGQSAKPEQTTEVSIQDNSLSNLANEWVTVEDIIARGHVSLAYEYMNEASIAYNNEDGSKTLYVKYLIKNNVIIVKINNLIIVFLFIFFTPFYPPLKYF